MKYYIYNELKEDVTLINENNENIIIKNSGAAEIECGKYIIKTKSNQGFTFHESRYLSGQKLNIDTDGTFYPFKLEEEIF